MEYKYEVQSLDQEGYWGGIAKFKTFGDATLYKKAMESHLTHKNYRIVRQEALCEA